MEDNDEIQEYIETRFTEFQQEIVMYELIAEEIDALREKNPILATKVEE